MIVHITGRGDWAQAQAAGVYIADTLAKQGFIHCSTPEQVVRVANFVYRGQADLVLLCIDPVKVRAEIKYEDAGRGNYFPHIYGPLNLEAVFRVVDFPVGPDGLFTLPEGIAWG